MYYVVVDLTLPSLPHQPGEVGPVPMEIALLQRLSEVSSHEGVVRMLDWFKVEEQGFLLVLERPQQCQDLFDFITESGALSERLALRLDSLPSVCLEPAPPRRLVVTFSVSSAPIRFFRQIVEALQFIHAQGVVHRDIKDENIVVDTRTLKVKIVDFGSGAPLKDTPYSEFEGTDTQLTPAVRLSEGEEVTVSCVTSALRCLNVNNQMLAPPPRHPGLQRS